nr:2'-deoxycytidine 5'-triphosphate deaminase (DCD) [uncultured bacterium]AIA18094.1 2'-deoxycytidine 5'-triphosphate deaminase (DCD) [uncultured bacterium]
MRPETSGVLASHQLTDLIRGSTPLITSDVGITDDQIQPASLDLTLGNRVYGIPASVLPRPGQKVSELIDQHLQYPFTLEEGHRGFLPKGNTFIVPLRERLALPPGFWAKFSPKSSTGRTDTFVRILAEGVHRFDFVPAGYEGPLYAEITPLSFPVYIKPGLSLIQMRVRTGDPCLSSDKVAIRQAKEGIFFSQAGEPIAPSALDMQEYGVYMHVDLERPVVGFVARSFVQEAISLSEMDKYDPALYWEPIPRPKNGEIVIAPGSFYLLATKERVRIPSDWCGDIPPYDATIGEFRSHYAGFFDPGFGGEQGTTGVLEVRGRELPFAVTDGQAICRMDFERMSETPATLYEGNYAGDPRPSLSKHFAHRRDVWGE